MDRGISLTVRNDASFVVDANLSIYEHQSTICPNMPIRSLIYFTSIIEPMIKGKNIYGRKLIQIPTPRFAVFYNGMEEQPEVQQMKLSDSFAHVVDKPEIELTVTVYNINKGNNTELLSKCKFLKDFLIKNRSEVVKVTKLDYTFDRQLELEREDSREEGRAEGRMEGFIKGIEALIEDNLEDGRSSDVIISKIVKRFDVDLEKAKNYFDDYLQKRKN